MSFAQTPLELEEAFVALFIKKNRGSPFYRVMVDAEERPYLNIEDFLGNLIEHDVSCLQDQQFCEVLRPSDQQIFWISGKTYRYGNTKTPGVVGNLPPNALVVKEGSFWLRYDVLAQWMPFDVLWSLDEYRLNTIPNFLLPTEIFEEIQYQREIATQERLEQERLDQLKAITAPEDYRTELRYDVYHERSNQFPRSTAGLSYDLSMDLWQGNLLIVGGIRQTFDNGEDDIVSTESWNYRQVNRPQFHLLEVGNFSSERSLLIPSIRLKNGIRLNRLEQRKGSGMVDFIGQTQAQTEVDLWRNGVLLETQKTGDDGHYAFNDYLAANGDRFILRFYYVNGSSSEKEIRIANNQGLVLKQSQWDASFLSGESEHGSLTRLSWRYGLIDNFSAGVHGLQIPDAGSTENAPGVDLAWRPFSTVGVVTENVMLPNDLAHAVQLNITTLAPHFFQVESRSTSRQNPLLKFYSSGISDSNYFQSLRHSVPLGRWQLENHYSQHLTARTLRNFARYRITRTLSTAVTRTEEWDANLVPSLKIPVELSYNTTHHSASIEYEWTSQEIHNTTARYRFQGKEEYQWDWSISASQNTLGNTSYSLALVWRPTVHFKSEVRKNSQSTSVRATWSDILSSPGGPSNWKHFGTGTLTGIVMSPERDGVPAEPLEAIVVKAGSLKAITNEHGEYTIHGIPSHQRVEVELDAGSLDASLLPAEPSVIMEFRPGTRIVYHPELTWSTGLDGMVSLKPGDITVTAEVHVFSDDGLKVKSTEVESDGFFMLEGLSPGTYTLKVSGLRGTYQDTTIVLTPGIDWVSEVSILPAAP